LQGADFGAAGGNVDFGKYVSNIAEPRRMKANYHCHVPELRSRLGLVLFSGAMVVSLLVAHAKNAGLTIGIQKRHRLFDEISRRS
jgi:hypothetical protein